MTKQIHNHSEEEAYRAELREQKQAQISHKELKANRKWYQRSWVIIFFLIFIQPLGIFLMWKGATWEKNLKWIITALVGSMFLWNFYNTFKENKIFLPPVAEEQSVTESEIGKYAFNATNGVYRGKIVGKKPCATKPEMDCYILENEEFSQNMEAPVLNVIVKDTPSTN